MFVLEFFTVYPDSVSDKIILLNKKLLDKHYIGIILVATVSPLSRKSIFFRLVTSQIKIESQNFRCYNRPNIVSRHILTRLNLNPARRLPDSVYINSLL